MTILILGGSVFLGKHLAAEALKRGHTLTLFNRGQTNPNAFPEAEHLIGDRDGALEALSGRRWNAVLDMCGYLPRLVRDSVSLLKDSGHYAFISTISVYADPSKIGLKEADAVGILDDPRIEEVNAETYGPLKAMCEREVESIFQERSLIIRSGLIVGPDDKTDRFTYWPVRMAKGGNVLVPSRLDQPTQFIDVRDLAAWTMRKVEAKASGTFNATGPAERLEIGSVLEECRVAVGPESRFVIPPPGFFEEHGVEPWSDLPLALPEDGSMDGMATVNIEKALDQGLTFRPLRETIFGTLSWFSDHRAGEPLRVGLSRERELALLSEVKKEDAAAHQ